MAAAELVAYCAGAADFRGRDGQRPVLMQMPRRLVQLLMQLALPGRHRCRQAPWRCEQTADPCPGIAPGTCGEASGAANVTPAIASVPSNAILDSNFMASTPFVDPSIMAAGPGRSA
jgi:hypothetical protein